MSSYSFPTVPDFKAQFVRDFPYAVPVAGGGTGASIGLQLSGMSVSSLTLNAGGSGYPEVPDILIYGSGGFGAIATAAITNGAVSSVTLISGGQGFMQAPLIYISNGAGDNTDTTKVTDFDIVTAFNAATQFNLNASLFSSQYAYVYAINLLTAHYMVLNLQAGNTGISGKAEWLTSSKTVGNVSEQYSIPTRMMKSPYLSKLSKTTYGAQFLELVSPLLIANIRSYYGGTNP